MSAPLPVRDDAGMKHPVAVDTPLGLLTHFGRGKLTFTFLATRATGKGTNHEQCRHNKNGSKNVLPHLVSSLANIGITDR